MDLAPARASASNAAGTTTAPASGAVSGAPEIGVSPYAGVTTPDVFRDLAALAQRSEPLLVTSLQQSFQIERDCRDISEELLYRARTNTAFGSPTSDMIRADVVADVSHSLSTHARGSSAREQLLESIVDCLAIDRGRTITRSEYFWGKPNEVSPLNVQLALCAEQSISTMLQTGRLEPTFLADLAKRPDYAKLEAGVHAVLDDIFSIGQRHFSSIDRAIFKSFETALGASDDGHERRNIARAFHVLGERIWRLEPLFDRAIEQIEQRGQLTTQERHELQSIFKNGHPSSSQAWLNKALDFGAQCVNFTRNVARAAYDGIMNGPAVQAVREARIAELQAAERPHESDRR